MSLIIRDDEPTIANSWQKMSSTTWEPLLDAKNKPLYPMLIKELDAMKALRPTGGEFVGRQIETAA